jgi:hypothetical protein
MSRCIRAGRDFVLGVLALRDRPPPSGARSAHGCDQALVAALVAESESGISAT